MTTNRKHDTPLAMRLRIDRRAAGLTQKQVCNRIDIVTTQLSSWENATYRPNLENVLALAEVYGQDPMEYVTLLKASPSSGRAGERARKYRAQIAERGSTREIPDPDAHGAMRVDDAAGELPSPVRRRRANGPARG